MRVFAGMIFVPISMLVAACGYDASFDDCTVHCSSTSGCPTGLTCGDEGLCERSNQSGLCGVPACNGTGVAVVTTLAGSPGATGSTDGTGSAARFNFPLGVAVDSEGNVYVADEHNHTLRQVTPGGAVTTIAGNAGAAGNTDGTGSAARFDTPTGVALNSNETGGIIYIVDYGNDIVRTVTPAGAVTTIAGSPGAAGSTDGTGSAARFSHPIGAAGVDVNGNIYVADANNDTIRKVTPGGVVTTLAGSPGIPGSADGAGSAARFSEPYGVAVDNDGNIYVVDSGNDTVRKVTPSGVVTTLAGSPGIPGSDDGAGSVARFNNPQGVAVDSSGTIYIADTVNETIRAITPGGVVTTLAGTPGVGGSTDGAGSAARFDSPRGVTVDSCGNIYVADSDNQTIRKITL